jgi:hypothetical protein
LVGHGNIVSDLVSDGLFDVLVKAAEACRRKQERANKMILSLHHESPISVDAENVFEDSVALIMLRIGISEAFGQYFNNLNDITVEANLAVRVRGPKWTLDRESASVDWSSGRRWVRVGEGE